MSLIRIFATVPHLLPPIPEVPDPPVIIPARAPVGEQDAEGCSDADMFGFCLRLGYQCAKTKTSDCDFELEQFIEIMGMRWAGLRGDFTSSRAPRAAKRMSELFFERMILIKALFAESFPYMVVDGKRVYQLGLVGHAYRYCFDLHPPEAEIDTEAVDPVHKARVRVRFNESPEVYFRSAARVIREEYERREARVANDIKNVRQYLSEGFANVTAAKERSEHGGLIAEMQWRSRLLIGESRAHVLDQTFHWARAGIVPIDFPLPPRVDKADLALFAELMGPRKMECITHGVSAYAEMYTLRMKYDKTPQDPVTKLEMHLHWADQYHMIAELLELGFHDFPEELTIAKANKEMAIFRGSTTACYALWYSHYYAAVYAARAGSAAAAFDHYEKAEEHFGRRLIPSHPMYTRFMVEHIAAGLMLIHKADRTLEIIDKVRGFLPLESVDMIVPFLDSAQRGASINKRIWDKKEAEKEKKRVEMMDQLRITNKRRVDEYKRRQRALANGTLGHVKTKEQVAQDLKLLDDF